jgi:ABC-type polysaccharide/polyol phosphate transport system ATPase subunit
MTFQDTIVIEARNVSKMLPDGVGEVKKAFLDLNLDVHHGRRIALFSVNAYEARTLLDCLSGIEQPDQGLVVHHRSVSWPLGTNQTFRKRLSGYMNARFAAEVYSEPGRVAHDLRFIQDLTGVDDVTFHQPIGVWKASTRKSLELAISLAFNFDVILVGKIGGWDHRSLHPSSLRIREVFEQRIDGRTLVVAAPGQNRLALDYCDEGLVILDGRLAYRGDTEVCLEMVKEESQRQKAERRQQVSAQAARFLADAEERDFDFDDSEDIDTELDLNESRIGARALLPDRYNV